MLTLYNLGFSGLQRVGFAFIESCASPSELVMSVFFILSSGIVTVTLYLVFAFHSSQKRKTIMQHQKEKLPVEMNSLSVMTLTT